MNISVKALTAPSEHTLEGWLNEPRKAMCGNKFTPSEPMWRPDATSTSVNWQAVLGCVEDDWQPWLHAALALRMAEIAQNSMRPLTDALIKAVKKKLNILDTRSLVNLREELRPNDLWALTSFLRSWGTYDLEKKPRKELVQAYENLPKKKRSTNDVILSLDPEQGPLTPTEADALFHWCHQKFSVGELATERFLYLLLALRYGTRSKQQRMWVFDDFFEQAGKFKIRIFYAKQNGGHWRDKSKLFDLDPIHYNLIKSYRNVTLAQLKKTYPDSADWDKAIGNVPLFRRVAINSGGQQFPVLVPSDSHHVLENRAEAYFHVSAGTLKNWLVKIQGTQGFPISHRTHKPIKITSAHRFRHTYGTDLSNEGYSEFAIAEALLHSDPRSSKKYRDVSADLLRLCDEKMQDHLAVAIGAFSGRIVTSREVAENGHNADRQIQDLAVCGSSQMCHLDAPYSCYACPKFQPVLDADHSKALKRLEARRAKTMEVDTTVGLTWDRAILACRKVILDCEEMKASKLSSEGDS